MRRTVRRKTRPVEGFRSVPRREESRPGRYPGTPLLLLGQLPAGTNHHYYHSAQQKGQHTNMKTTLQEKLALIPATPESPATLAGSLHPSQAISDGKLLISSAPNSVNNRSML